MSEEVELKSFLSYIGSERGLSANTRAAYESDLEQFFLYCQRKEISIPEASLKELRDFVGSLRKQSLSAKSVARKVSAVKQYYLFLLRENRIQSNPSELLSTLVREKSLPRFLTVDEMFSLIAAAKGENEREIRDRALLELWYATGARVSEIAGLAIQSFDWKQGIVKIKGKGERERLVPISHQAIEWCAKYRDIRHEWIRRQELPPTHQFFISSRGKKLTRQAIWKLLKFYAERAGISKRVWPHLIRHSFATHVLQGGADLRAVQELMGHRSIATTEIYTHLDIENLKVMQLKYHPRS